MKSHIKFVSIVGWSRDKWLAWRNQHGIGGSDIGTILGLNQYQSNLELHLERSGLWDRNKDDNFHSYKGHVTESLIIDHYWKYWTGTPESVLENANNPEYIKKKCRKINGFMVNSKHPWLYASLDRLLPIGHTNMLTGEIMAREGVLEAKNMRAQEAQKYESGINPSFLAQTQTYMGICELNYAELQILIDSTYPMLYAFERSETFIENILDLTQEFWGNVLKARELVKVRQEEEMHGNNAALGEIDYQLSKLEPEPQSTQGYADFLKVKYRDIPPKQSIPGTQEQYEMAVELKRIQSQIEPLEIEEILLKNRIQKNMGDLNVEILDFAELGKVKWAQDVNGIRKFSSSIKIPQ